MVKATTAPRLDVRLEPGQTVVTTITYTVSDGPEPEPPRTTVGELRVGDRVYLSKLLNDAGWTFWPHRTEHIGTVREVRHEDERPNTTAAQRRMARRLMVTVDRGVRSLEVVFGVADTPICLVD